MQQAFFFSVLKSTYILKIIITIKSNFNDKNYGIVILKGGQFFFRGTNVPFLTPIKKFYK